MRERGRVCPRSSLSGPPASCEEKSFGAGFDKPRHLLLVCGFEKPRYRYSISENCLSPSSFAGPVASLPMRKR